NHADTADSYNCLGVYYDRINDFEKAKEYLDKALKIRLEVLGENHADTADSYNCLGVYYDRINDFEKSKEYYDKAQKIRLEVLGENHADTADSYNCLGVYYDRINDFEKSKEYYDKALKIRLEVLGENHADTAESYNNLGFYYYRVNELVKEREYFEKALRISLKLGNRISNINKSTKLFYNNLKSISYKKFFIDSSFSIAPFVKKAKIENFKLLKDFEIEFSPNINIIIGENSSGKTSLLQALTLGLLEENYSGESNEKYPNYITKSKDSANIDLTIDEYKKSVKITSQERTIDNIILSPFVLSYGSNIFTKYKLEVNDLVSDILEKKITNNFTNSIFKDYVDEFHNPKSILNELERIDTRRAKEVKKIFINTINNLQDEYELVYDKGKYFFKHNNKNIFKLENLSEGYRNNILLITDILVRILGIGKTPETIEGVILIDEFDRHLHPKWQSNIVSKLLDTFPKIQFILTTHNPMSILDRNEDEITIIKEIDGKLEAQKGSGTKNIDVGMVLLKYFGVNSLVGEEMQKNLSKFTKIKLLDELTDEQEDELKSLEDKLSETVATNFIYNRGYFQFLKFIKEHKDIEFEKLDEMSEDEIDDLLKDFEESL
ncbi:tetratricopeptide repeat protein, partial [uncultured Arcobacter sp.]|uniref:tetratricopeptide repeat protein n=1 Tax=uncultured Arcobacter sp. TaxID=165434 RepID=UPI0026223621